jgi:hypothetical protein
MRGRMQGALMIVAAGGPWVSDIVHGPAGATIGTTWTISGGGVLTVAAMLVAVLAFPVLWQYRGAASDTTDDPTEDLDTVEPRA